MQKITKLLLPLFVLAIIFQGVFGGIESADAATYENGEYDISVTPLKSDGSGVSDMDKFMENSAKLISNNGQNTIQMTLNQASWWKSFVVAGQSVTTVSDGGDTRVVQVAVQDPSQSVSAHVSIDAGDLYKGEHDVLLSFDVSGVPAASGTVSEEGSTDTDEASTATPEDNPKTGDHTPLLLLTAGLLLSGVVLGRKFIFAK